MKKNIVASLLTCMLLIFVNTSCDHREYANSDYPNPTVYLPMALETVWHIDKANEEGVSINTPGAPVRYILDKANNKLIIPMGVVQAGIELKSFNVGLYVDNSTINSFLLEGGILPIGTLPLPETAYILPDHVKMSSNSQSASFNLEIQLSALTGANLGKKFAIAVEIDASTVRVSEGLGVAVICIDTAFLKDLL